VKHLFHTAKVEPSTASESSFNCAREWIRRCTTSHPSCRSVCSSTSYRPTRLLRISGSSNNIRLCEKDEVPKDVMYATLSHCWGSVVEHKLTTTNIDSFKKSISLHSLAKTFQDAVEAARRLGVDYIWIDCFCIIQDSLEDWTQESVAMQHVYGNSYCNIAVTASRDGRGGCVRARDPNVVKPLKTNIR
jgi:hypothetical protein